MQKTQRLSSVLTTLAPHTTNILRRQTSTSPFRTLPTFEFKRLKIYKKKSRSLQRLIKLQNMNNVIYNTLIFLTKTN